MTIKANHKQLWDAKLQAQTNWVAGLPNHMNKLLKRNSFSLGIFSAVLLLCQLCFPFSALSAELQTSLDDDYDSLIVYPKERVINAKRMDKLMLRYRISKFQKINDKAYVIPLSKHEDKNSKIAELKKSGQFSLVEPDYKLRLDEMVPERNYVKITKHSSEDNPVINTGTNEDNEITPNDKGFASQYYLRTINANRAWSVTTGDSSIIVGILDTGIDKDHPDLTGKVIDESDIDQDYYKDILGHGTEVAGIIAAKTNNNQGIAGISWNTKVLPLKITDDPGQAKVSTVVSALDEAYNRGVKVVQISLSTNQYSTTLQKAIKQAQDRGILIVSSAGNSGINELRFPAAYSDVIAVGSVSQSKELESYSTIGDFVGLVAPGTGILTTSKNQAYANVSGTSFSTPQVAGAASLVWSINPNLSSDEVREILFQSAEDLGDPGKDEKYGYGLLNTDKAVQMAKAKMAEKN